MHDDCAFEMGKSREGHQEHRIVRVEEDVSPRRASVHVHEVRRERVLYVPHRASTGPPDDAPQRQRKRHQEEVGGLGPVNARALRKEASQNEELPRVREQGVCERVVASAEEAFGLHRARDVPQRVRHESPRQVVHEHTETVASALGLRHVCKEVRVQLRGILELHFGLVNGAAREKQKGQF
jgi:hypothetical protein